MVMKAMKIKPVKKAMKAMKVKSSAVAMKASKANARLGSDDESEDASVPTNTIRCSC